MNILKYHNKVWLPFSNKIDKKIKPYKILRVIKKLFDIHFTILALLGIIATPSNDLDCYIYIFKRSKPHKYKELGWSKRLRLIKDLLNQAWRA